MVFLLTLLTCLSAWAQMDLSLGLQGRSFPGIGAEAYAESGYNQLLWGRKEGPKDVLYGLIRPSLGASTSGVINSLKGELELFPVSFLGLAVGRQIIHSNYSFPFFHCDQVACKGEFGRDFVEEKLVLGYKGWIVLGNYKVDIYRGPRNQRPLGDWRNVILGGPGRDTQHEQKLFFGKAVGTKMAGILAERVQFQSSREYKESYAAVYQTRHKDTNYLFGAGTFRTTHVSMGLIFYLRIHYQMLPTLKLF